MKKLNLFCFPYAGGGSNIYLKWRKYLDNSINLIPIELAGRVRRFDEPLKYDIKSIVDDCYNIIKNDIDNLPYIMFGHSMGCVIVCELIDRIYECCNNKPCHIFLSGRNPVHIPCNHSYHELPDEEFLNKIIEMGGTNQEIFENEELKKLFLPILKADFQAVETYRRQSKDFKWDINLSILNGINDSLMQKSYINEWNQYTKGNVDVHYYKGDHFYLNSKFIDIIALINKTAKDKNNMETKKII